MIAIIACESANATKMSDVVDTLWYNNQIFQINDFSINDVMRNWNSLRFDAIIISGWSEILTDTNKKKVLDVFSFISSNSVPLLAIWFAHQLLGQYYYATYRNWDMIDGAQKIQVVHRGEELFQKIRRKVFYELHTQEITLPENFRLLAYSNNCKNEAMKHLSKEIYGLQFYPEFSWKSGEILIANFLKIAREI